jgi:hypothetical protein
MVSFRAWMLLRGKDVSGPAESQYFLDARREKDIEFFPEHGRDHADRVSSRASVREQPTADDLAAVDLQALVHFYEQHLSQLGYRIYCSVFWASGHAVLQSRRLRCIYGCGFFSYYIRVFQFCQPRSEFWTNFIISVPQLRDQSKIYYGVNPNCIFL